MTAILRWLAYAACCLVASTMFSSCASTKAVSLNIHTEPEGSYIVYKVDNVERHESNSAAQWIFLGVSPYRGLALLKKNVFDDNDTISFKVMRNGYMDQVKEWTGEKFLQEYEKNDVLIWTPRLVKSLE